MLHELFPAFLTLTVGIHILIATLYCNEVNFLKEMKVSIDAAIPASLIFYVIIFDYLITTHRV